MAINIIALAMLFFGVLYLDEFRDSWIERRIDNINIQADIISGAIGESASGDTENSEIQIEQSRQIIERLMGATNNRTRLYDIHGTLLVDSQFMTQGRGIYSVPLPPPERTDDLKDTFLIWMNSTLDSLSSAPQYPPYEENPNLTAFDYNEVVSALNGETKTTMRASPDGVIIAVAVPVQRFRRVLGVVLLTADTSDIQNVVERERLRIVKIFGLTILVTVFLSFFLANTIVRPIRRLSTVADRVRSGFGRARDLKEFSGRKDEIGDLSISLAAMTRALYDRIGAIETFAADVAHEIKNPLSSVRSAVESIKRTNDPAIHAQLLKIIEDDTKRLDRLISDISHASRLDAELLRAESQIFDIAEMTKLIVSSYNMTSNEKHAKVSSYSEDEKPFLIKGLDERIGQVIRNLIDNALSFSPKDGEVFVRLSRVESGIKISVEDEGPGLVDGVGDKIFERFYSERPKEEAFGTHSGLGLNISKQIIEAHHGTILVSNNTDTENKVLGACFSVYLPSNY
jgi:two-component system sensor histidine kinase ChvG